MSHAPPANGETGVQRPRQWYTHSYNRLTLYRATLICSQLLPRSIRFVLARMLAVVFRQMMPQEYAAAQQNMRRILSTPDRTAIERHARALFRNFACCFADLLSINRQTLSVQQRYVRCVHGEERLHTALASGRGFIVATAHIGNWDLAGKLLSAYGRIVHILVAPEQEAAVQRLLRDQRRPEGLRFMANDEPGVFMKLFMALRRGEVVAFQADRGTGHRSDVPISFFGAPALFPSGPLFLAAAAQVPVLPCFCLLRSDDQYDIFVEEPIVVSRGCEVAALQQIVYVLERYIAMAPDQWFNFYDVWNCRLPS